LDTHGKWYKREYAQFDPEGCNMRTMESVLFSAILMLFSTAGLAQSATTDPTPIDTKSDTSSDTVSTPEVCTTHKTGDAQAVSRNCREAFQRIGRKGLKKACAGTLLDQYHEKVSEFLAVCHCPGPCIQ
jgi:hypothetical protein